MTLSVNINKAAAVAPVPHGISFEVTDSGKLQISIQEHDKENVQELWENCQQRHPIPEDGFLADFLEMAGWSTNGRLHVFDPSWNGSLTEAPMVSDYDFNPVLWEDTEATEADIEEQKKANVWYYGNYMIDSYVEQLIEYGVVTFNKA